jgi:hypothetical protein
MGRGRAKAKQTKVARALKYGGPQTDFDRLQAELSGQPVPVPDPVAEEIDESDDPHASDPYASDPYADDPYAKYYEEEDESA